jgi:hypothetical protein
MEERNEKQTQNAYFEVKHRSLLNKALLIMLGVMRKHVCCKAKSYVTKQEGKWKS